MIRRERVILLLLLAVGQMRLAAGTLPSKELFVKVTADKEHVYEQEPVVLSFSVYSVFDVADMEGKPPAIDGFQVREVELPKMKTFHEEMVGGRTYNSALWSKYIAYPQTTGDITIPATIFRGTVMVESRGDPMEDFFNDRQHFQPTKVSVSSPSITIHVNPLPPRPSGFSGGVGTFDVSASMEKAEVKAGEPVYIKVVVRGSGNLRLIKRPAIVFPRDFEVYDVKVADSTRFTDKGYSGSMIYSYTAVPKNQGRYTIPPVAFTYFDLQARTYKTIKTQPFNLKVNSGADNGDAVYDYSQPKRQPSFWEQIANSFTDNMWLVALLAGILVIVLIIVVILIKNKTRL